MESIALTTSQFLDSARKAAAKADLKTLAELMPDASPDAIDQMHDAPVFRTLDDLSELYGHNNYAREIPEAGAAYLAELATKIIAEAKAANWRSVSKLLKPITLEAAQGYLARAVFASSTLEAWVQPMAEIARILKEEWEPELQRAKEEYKRALKEAETLWQRRHLIRDRELTEVEKEVFASLRALDEEAAKQSSRLSPLADIEALEAKDAAETAAFFDELCPRNEKETSI